MLEWLQQVWRKSKSWITRIAALILLIFLTVLSCVSLFSDTGFAKEVATYRWLILVAAVVIALVLAIGVLLWRWPPARRVLNRLRLFFMTAVRWVYGNWKLVFGMGILVAATCGVYALAHSLWAVVLTLSLFLAAVLLARYRQGTHKLESAHRDDFREDFSQPDLPNWKYSGEWSVEADREGYFLTVTQSELGGIAEPCLGWKDYMFRFDTRIVRHSTSWIIRAASRGHYVMLQCQKDRLRPHFRQVDRWALPEEWTNPNAVSLPQILPLNEWFTVCIQVIGKSVVVTLTVRGKEMQILNSPLLAPPIAPEDYSVGSMGFRASEYECAHFRNVHVERLLS